ncbi:hypothetical protein GUJ93_ZPchr0008g12099 [Zizania palustris]|uniref:Uncharacterized protein n=1 Tax=Zizania palustris TaxID=103762 RepID=A0A8J5UWV0_ZIZPA|nr:hypothetical protein GUJ93_ZPchr0008g12099 [Zizania palustris]
MSATPASRLHQETPAPLARSPVRPLPRPRATTIRRSARNLRHPPTPHPAIGARRHHPPIAAQTHHRDSPTI